MAREVQLSAAASTAVEALLRPRSIGVIGASKDPDKWGTRAMRALLKFGYEGRIYPVNPRVDAVCELTCYRRIEDLPEPLDLAIISLPARVVPDMIRKLGANGTKIAVVFSAGFAETGQEGAKIQAQLLRELEETPIRLLGPNSLGAINIKDSITPSASSTLHMPDLSHRPIAFEPISVVSQSGAIGLGSVLNRGHDHGIGFSRMISTGSELDLGMADCINYLIGDDQTDVISFYAEGFRDTRPIISALEKALSAGKPVIGLMAGRSSVGQRVARSHTGLMAEEGRVLRGIFGQLGVTLVTDPDDMYEKAAAFHRTGTRGGDRIAVVTLSGGIGAILADLCVEEGLVLGSFEPRTQELLRRFVPEFGSVHNPLDIPGQLVLGDGRAGFQCLNAVLDDSNVDACVLVLTAMTLDPLVTLLLSEDFNPQKPLFILFAGGSLQSAAIEKLERSRRFPIFWRPDKCISAIVDINLYNRARSRRCRDTSHVVSREFEEDPRWEPPAKLLTLSESESANLLRDYGIKVANHAVVSSFDEAAQAAAKMGYPVCLKIHGRDISHKSELGGVFLNLTSPNELETAFQSLERVYAAQTLPVEALVQPMMIGGAEVLIGSSWRPSVGPIFSLAVGGTQVGLWGKPSFRALPVTADDIEDMIEETSLETILRGSPSGPELDRPALVEAGLQLSNILGMRADLREVEINPIIVREKGLGVVAVDSLVVVGDGIGSEGGPTCS